jgi:DNA-binding PadR family transcriptional regulator
METNGWLRSSSAGNQGSHARKEYRLTKEGARILAFLRTQVEELHHEVVEEAHAAGKTHPRGGS